MLVMGKPEFQPYGFIFFRRFSAAEEAIAVAAEWVAARNADRIERTYNTPAAPQLP